MIDKIYEVIKPSFFWVFWPSEKDLELVMIGDVLQRHHDQAIATLHTRFNKDQNGRLYIPDGSEEFRQFMFQIYHMWKDKRFHIDAQSDDCIAFIYSLIK